MKTPKVKLRSVLNQPAIFWSIVVFLLLGTYFILDHNLAQLSTKPTSSPTTVELSHKEKKITINPDNITRMDFEKEQLSAEENVNSLWGNTYGLLKSNSTLILLFLYTVIIVALFIYKEKQNRIKLEYLKIKEDELLVAKLRAEERGHIYDSLWDDMEKYRDSLEPELKVCALRDQLEKNLECCMADGIIVSTRKVLERLLLPLQYQTFPDFDGKTTLNGMIYHLSKKGVLTKTMEKDARAIQSRGNTAAHADTDASIAFDAKDAMSSIGYLLHFIKELEAAKMKKV